MLIGATQKRRPSMCSAQKIPKTLAMGVLLEKKYGVSVNWALYTGHVDKTSQTLHKRLVSEGKRAEDWPSRRELVKVEAGLSNEKVDSDVITSLSAFNRNSFEEVIVAEELAKQVTITLRSIADKLCASEKELDVLIDTASATDKTYFAETEELSNYYRNLRANTRDKDIEQRKLEHANTAWNNGNTCEAVAMARSKAASALAHLQSVGDSLDRKVNELEPSVDVWTRKRADDKQAVGSKREEIRGLRDSYACMQERETRCHKLAKEQSTGSSLLPLWTPAPLLNMTYNIHVHPCPLCTCGFPFNEQVHLPCGHCFHDVCIKVHIQQGHRICPIETCARTIHPLWFRAKGYVECELETDSDITQAAKWRFLLENHLQDFNVAHERQEEISKLIPPPLDYKDGYLSMREVWDAQHRALGYLMSPQGNSPYQPISPYQWPAAGLQPDFGGQDGVGGHGSQVAASCVVEATVDSAAVGVEPPLQGAGVVVDSALGGEDAFQSGRAPDPGHGVQGALESAGPVVHATHDHVVEGVLQSVGHVVELTHGVQGALQSAGLAVDSTHLLEGALQSGGHAVEATHGGQGVPSSVSVIHAEGANIDEDGAATTEEEEAATQGAATIEEEGARTPTVPPGIEYVEPGSARTPVVIESGSPERVQSRPAPRSGSAKACRNYVRVPAERLAAHFSPGTKRRLSDQGGAQTSKTRKVIAEGTKAKSANQKTLFGGEPSSAAPVSAHSQAEHVREKKEEAVSKLPKRGRQKKEDPKVMLARAMECGDNFMVEAGPGAKPGELFWLLRCVRGFRVLERSHVCEWSNKRVQKGKEVVSGLYYQWVDDYYEDGEEDGRRPRVYELLEGKVATIHANLVLASNFPMERAGNRRYIDPQSEQPGNQRSKDDHSDGEKPSIPKSVWLLDQETQARLDSTAQAD